MITYKIKPEYLTLWGDDETEVTMDDIERCAADWEKPVSELLGQVEPVNYRLAVELMDDDIREAVHADISPCSDAEFLMEYCKRHEEKYGKPFEY